MAYEVSVNEFDKVLVVLHCAAVDSCQASPSYDPLTDTGPASGTVIAGPFIIHPLPVYAEYQRSLQETSSKSECAPNNSTAEELKKCVAESGRWITLSDEYVVQVECRCLKKVFSFLQMHSGRDCRLRWMYQK